MPKAKRGAVLFIMQGFGLSVRRASKLIGISRHARKEVEDWHADYNAESHIVY